MHKNIHMRKHIIPLLLLTFLTTPLFAQDTEEEEEWYPTERILNLTDYHMLPSANHIRSRIGKRETAPLTCMGSPRVPVVLVQFPDRPFQASGETPEQIKENFNLFFNGTDNSQVEAATDGNMASIRNYFIDQSGGQFSPDFTIIGPVTLSQSYSFYGKNSGSNKNFNITTFYKEALTLTVRQNKQDWSVFDNDGNGSVDIVFFIFAGWGENKVSAYDPNAIWPHEIASPSTITLDDGTQIVFACMGVSSEATYKSKAQLDQDCKTEPFAPTGYNPANLRMDGIGTSIHELGHALGLPDTYDTNSSTTHTRNFGIDGWSVMDYGCYTYGGRCPCGYSAYERAFMQWETLDTISEPAVVSLKPYQKGGSGLVILNDQNTDEYYLLENRQPLDWDAYSCYYYNNSKGLMVSHIDYKESIWLSNRVNAEDSHPRQCLLPANNSYIGSFNAKTAEEYKASVAGMLFPFAATYQDLTDDTDPASVVYTGKFLGKPIRNIQQKADGSITFCFRTHGQLQEPELEEAEDVTDHSFTARWQTVEHATAYVAELYRDEVHLYTDTLTENHINYTGLTPSTHLRYRVMALADSPEDYIPSPWSEFAYVETLVDALPGIPASEQKVDVYTIDGKKVSTLWADELSRLHRLTGVYILRYADGQVRKMMVR